MTEPRGEASAPAPSPSQPDHARLVALAGNPNAGKTTVFNALTGLRHRVANYAGVTVERKEGRLTGTDVTVLDLPGTVSLNATSPDEEVARDVLLGRYPPLPELVVVVVDASNLQRNLYLASQIMDLRLPVVLCLNMTDVAHARGVHVDAGELSATLGVPVIPAVAHKGVGLDDLRRQLLSPIPCPAERGWELPQIFQAEVERLGEQMQGRGEVDERGAFYAALNLLSEPVAAAHASRPDQQQVEAARKRLSASGLDPISDPVEARYAWISRVADRCVTERPVPPTPGERFDRIATHRVGGIALFVLVMALIFQALFSWLEAPMNWITAGQEFLGTQAAQLLPEGDLQSLVVDGVIAGVGGVVVFFPQIFFLFFCIGLLEDSGYMARAAFVMDRVMHRAGLHGKSFIPLLSSFACAIPGVMAARTIENARDRMVTILVAPFMSCSARLPVYTLLIAGFIPSTRLWGVVPLPAVVMVSLYMLGLVAALLTAALLKRTYFHGDPPLFLMELPPYKPPSLRIVLAQTWERASEFLTRAGSVILAISLILWFAMNYPGSPNQDSADRLRHSLAGRAGHLLEPVIEPFGMDWKVGIGILGSFAAREVFVSTMAVVYNVEDEDEEKTAVSLQNQMRQEVNPATGGPRFTPAAACALMVFYVLAMQCVSTMAVVRRETGSWKWPLIQWAYMSIVAWGAAVITYQLGLQLGAG